MEPITGAVQTYDWGMRTPDCQARLRNPRRTRRLPPAVVL